MRESPKLPDALIQATLQIQYDLSIVTLTFLPIGNDAASFVYRVVASDGTNYFLKVRMSPGFSALSIVIPRFLYEHGIAHIITPVPTKTQTLWVHLNDFVLSLYPFIDARTATEAGLTKQHWHALGATLRQIHSSQLPGEILQIVPQETFIPSRRQVLRNLESVISNKQNLVDPIQRQLSEFWQTRQTEIHALIDKTDRLGNQLRRASLPRVVCHADLHTWNVLLDAAQHMWIVDWDETMLAPKERDLMFVIGGIGRNLVSAEQTTFFLQGYDDAAIDRRALGYYRYAWAVQEMGAYAEDVFFVPDLSAPARSDSVRAFIDIFQQPQNSTYKAVFTKVGQ